MDLIEVNEQTLQWESEHWWIRARQLYLAQALKELSKKQDVAILEIGCGSGVNLKFIADSAKANELQVKTLIGFDPNLNAPMKQKIENHLKNKEILITENFSVIQEQKFDLIVAMDVLEHISNDQETLLQWKKLLKDDTSVLFATVPALRFLWSQHDVHLLHHRRYQKQDFLKLFGSFHVIRWGYCFSFLVPLVYISRVLSNSTSNSQLKNDRWGLHAFFYLLSWMEFGLLKNKLFGTSLFLFTRR